MNRSVSDRLSLVLVVIGAINWLLVGLFNFDLVTALFGGTLGGTLSAASRVVFAIVGLAGIYTSSLFFRETASVKE